MSGTLEHDVLLLEERLTLATRELDLDALDSIYADDIMFTGVTGATCDKSSLMDEARRGLAQRQDAAARHFVATFDKEDIKVVAHGDTAVTSYRFIVTIQNNGQETLRRFRTTNVWMKRQPGWQVIAGHTASLDAVPGVTASLVHSSQRGGAVYLIVARMFVFQHRLGTVERLCHLQLPARSESDSFWRRSRLPQRNNLRVLSRRQMLTRIFKVSGSTTP